MASPWQQIIDIFSINQPFMDLLWIVISLGFFMIYSGIIFISAIARITGVARNRIAFAKCARQLARLGLITGWLLLIISRIWLYYNKASFPSDSMENFMLEFSWLLLSLGVLLTSIFYTLWGVLKNMPVLHSTIGMLAAIQNCLTFFAIIFTIRIIGDEIVVTNQLQLDRLLPTNWYDPFWSGIFSTLPLILAFAGGAAGCWLLISRKWDDFGRDYYSGMLPWCAGWARNMWFLLWLIYIVFSMGQLIHIPAMGENLIEETVHAVIWLMPFLFWLAFSLTKYPLRHKWILFVALILAFCFLPNYFLQIVQI